MPEFPLIYLERIDLLVADFRHSPKNRIGEVIKVILLRRIESFPEMGAQIRNAPFHMALLDCFREKLEPLNVEMPYLIAIASWLQGLNTSLGTGFENISHILGINATFWLVTNSEMWLIKETI